MKSERDESLIDGNVTRGFDGLIELLRSASSGRGAEIQAELLANVEIAFETWRLGKRTLTVSLLLDALIKLSQPRLSAALIEVMQKAIPLAQQAHHTEISIGDLLAATEPVSVERPGLPPKILAPVPLCCLSLSPHATAIIESLNDDATVASIRNALLSAKID